MKFKYCYNSTPATLSGVVPCCLHSQVSNIALYVLEAISSQILFGRSFIRLCWVISGVAASFSNKFNRLFPRFNPTCRLSAHRLEPCKPPPLPKSNFPIRSYPVRARSGAISAITIQSVPILRTAQNEKYFFCQLSKRTSS